VRAADRGMGHLLLSRIPIHVSLLGAGVRPVPLLCAYHDNRKLHLATVLLSVQLSSGEEPNAEWTESRSPRGRTSIGEPKRLVPAGSSRVDLPGEAEIRHVVSLGVWVDKDTHKDKCAKQFFVGLAASCRLNETFQRKYHNIEMIRDFRSRKRKYELSIIGSIRIGP
jgi:hypothetical protein